MCVHVIDTEEMVCVLVQIEHIWIQEILNLHSAEENNAVISPPVYGAWQSSAPSRFLVII